MDELNCVLVLVMTIGLFTIVMFVGDWVDEWELRHPRRRRKSRNG